MESYSNNLRIDIQMLKKLPTLSHTAERILSLTSKELTHLDEIIAIIEKDTPIMSKVLSMSNILYFGSCTPITNVKDALLKIGFNSLKNIALGISIFSLFKASGEKERSYKRLFNHSFATGVISQIICEDYLNVSSDEKFTAGLLHDIGFFALHYLYFELFQRLERAVLKGAPLLEAEREIVGIEHSEIGRWLSEWWGLPEVIGEVILYHHDLPEKSSNYAETVALIQLSNYIAEKFGYRIFECEYETSLYKDSIYKLLSLPDLEELIPQIKEKFSIEEFKVL